MSSKVKARYFDRVYWTTGEKSGYTIGGYNRSDYLNEAKAVFLTKLYGASGKWLEAGCAFGWVVEHLCKLGVDAYGFDISEYAIKNSPVADRVLCSGGLKRKLYQNGEFDIIVSFETAEHVHISDVDTWLGNLVCWLKPGGNMFLTICLGHGNFRGTDDNDVSHQTLQPREWWEDKLHALGLKSDAKRFNTAYNVVVETDYMGSTTGQENIIERYGLHVFAFRRPL